MEENGGLHADSFFSLTQGKIAVCLHILMFDEHGKSEICERTCFFARTI